MIPRLYIARTLDGNDLPLPAYQSQYHAGLLLRAAVGAPLKLNPGERVRIPVGFAIGIPQGFCGQIVSTPTLSEKDGIIVSDAPHLIHPANREPIFVLLQNVSSGQHIIHRGDIIAELVIVPAVQVCWNEVKLGAPTDKTEIEQMIIDDGSATQEKKQDMFKSYRRKKTTPRNRFKGPGKDA